MRVGELRALRLDLKVPKLEGEGASRPLGLSRVVQREGRGHVRGGEAQRGVGDRSDCREDKHARGVSLRCERYRERGCRVVAGEEEEPSHDLGLCVVRDLLARPPPEAAHLG